MDDWLRDVADGASRDAGGVPVALLGDYLPDLGGLYASARPADDFVAWLASWSTRTGGQ